MSEPRAESEFKNQKLYPIYTDLAECSVTIAATSTVLQSLPSPYSDDAAKIIQATGRLQKMIHELADFHTTEDPAIWSRLRHDMCTPVNAIKGYTELLLEDIPNASAEITTALQAILALSKDILTAISLLRLDSIQTIETPPIKMHMQGAAGAGKTKHPFMKDHQERGHILVVDDNLDNRELLKLRLEREGHKVTVAASGPEALSMVQSLPIDLILLDLLMPAMSGYEVLFNLKESLYYSNIPVIMISAVGDIDQIVQCIEAGAEDYLPKPFNPVLLRARIGACLDKKRLRQREQAQANQLKAAIESMDHGFVVFDAQGQCSLFNSTFKSWYPHLTLGITIQDLYQQLMRQSRYVMTEPERSAWLSQRCDHWQQISAMYVDVWADGRVFEMSISQAQDGSHVGIYKDITERHTEERRLTHLAYHDALTNLHNRKFFMEELQKLTPQTCAAVLYIDLDGFKKVNDTLGHDFGDEVLKHVAQSLSTCLRSADIAARIGGDEFCALLRNVKTQAEVLPVIERLFARIGSTHTFEGRTGTFGLSIGCAFYPDDGTTPDNIVNAADQAMYAAKNAGKGTHRFYTRL